MSNTATTAAASTNRMIPRRETSWQIMLITLFLAIKVVSSSSSRHQEENTMQLLSSLRELGHRYLRAKEMTRERFRKDHNFADFHFPASTEERHRILISCNESQSQENCLSKLLRTYDVPYDENNNINSGNGRRIEVVHNLESIHALSVDLDTQTLGNLAIDQDFVFDKDFARGPLVIEGSMAYYQPPNDGRNRNLQDIQKIPWGLDAIRAQEVWQDYGVQGKGVKICVLDSGLQASHEDFRQSNFDGYYGNEFVSPHWYEDEKGHGTHIAGTIAASDNTIGIVGIAPEAETYIVRVFDDDRKFYDFADGTAYSTDLIAAATICKEWGADIINASLGGSNYNRIEEDFFKDLYYKSGILTVAAAGNGGDDRHVYPAAYEGVLSVGAVDESLNMAKFSTWDPSTTDILAPGVNILSTFKENEYVTFSGTSMAAPHATGALALMLSYINDTQKDINAQDVFNALKHTTTSIDTSRDGRKLASNDDTDASHTIGIIDVYASIEYLESYKSEAKGRSPVISQKGSSNPSCENEVRLDITTDSKGGEIYYRLKRRSDQKVIWIAGPNTLDNNSEYSKNACLDPEDCYQFDIRDKGGDGISGEGGIELFYDGHKLYGGGDFHDGEMLKFGDCT